MSIYKVMKKHPLIINYLLVILLIFFPLCVKGQSTNPKFIEDDLNNIISLSVKPKRVISLAPNLTEMIFLIGQGDKIVGNTKFCNYPEKAKSIIKVGDMLSLNYEMIVNLKPDLIFITVEGNNKQQYQKLKQLGFNVFVSNPRDYLGIKKTFMDISIIFNVKDIAKNLIKNWDDKINSVRYSKRKQKKETAMFLVSVNPLMAAGPNTFVNQFLIICGLQNILSNSISNYPIINREEVISKNPDFIIVAKQDSLFIKDAVSIFPEWKKLTAIKNKNIIAIEPDLYFRPGPRFADAVLQLNEQVLKKQHK